MIDFFFDFSFSSTLSAHFYHVFGANIMRRFQKKRAHRKDSKDK